MITSSRPLHVAEWIRNEIRQAVDAHPFLEKFRSGQLGVAELRRFAFQWHLTAKAQRDVFPISRDNATRSEIINMLHEHYGNNESTDTEARLLTRFLESLDLQVPSEDDNQRIDAVQIFADGMREVWTSSSDVAAFGAHFALEVAAALMHDAFAQGVIRSSLRVDAAYFWYQESAKPQRADILTDEFTRNSVIETSLDEVQRGAMAVKERIVALLNGLQAATFAPGCIARSQDMQPRERGT